MVFSRGDGKRRHHKYVPDPLEENPKRIKVHAQRKFAQGSGMNSPVLTPIKEKEKSKPNGATSPPELLPSKRPATEDFLNFLCFRGTNTVPTKLDAFNESNFATSSASSASKQTSSASSGVQKIKTKSSSNQEIKKKLLDCRHAVPKGNAMRARTASDERQSIRKETIELRRKAAQRRSKPVRKTHPAILKRLGAARLRAGLRSGGQLPPGSDVGIKTDRKPRRGRPPRRRRRKAIKKEFDELPELEIKEEEESEEEIDEQPSKMPSMKLRTRGSSNSPAQSSRNLNVSTRPSRKTKEAATLYMEMLTKDLRSPDEEFDDEYLKDIPELPVSIKKENEGVKEMSIKRNKQLIKNKAKHGKSPKLTKKSIKVKEEVDSELDEENEPLLTRTQKSLKNDVSKLNIEKCITKDVKNTNKKRVEDFPKILKRSVGKRELRTLKEKRSMNDDHIESDKEEDEPSKVASKKIKEGKSEVRDSDLSISVTKTPPKRIELKQEIIKKNQKESKKAKKILPAKKLKENEDETINMKKQKEKNDKSMEEYEETDADKIKSAERRNSRKQVENEDLSPRNVIVPKSKPGKRPSSLKKGEKAKIPKLSKEMIKTESGSGSDQDEENEPLLKRKQKMQKKDSILNQKRTSSGSRYMRNNEPKIEMVMKDAPKKRGRKSLKGNMNVDDQDNLEDSIKPKDTASKIMIEEKCDVNKPVSKQETNITETIKETIPKRGRRISNIKKVNLNDEKEDSKAENTCETISSDRKNTAVERGLDVTNRVNITELRSKKLNDDSSEISIPSKVKPGENKISKKVIADEKEMNVVNKVKIADIKTKKIVEDELLVDIKEKRIDPKVSKNEKVLVEDKSIDIINRVKIMEYKASKKSISEEKGPDDMNLAKLGDNKIAKKGEEEKGIDFTNRVKIPEYEVSKKLNDESNKIKKTVDSKKNKCTVGIASNQENIENDIYNENDQRKKKISIEASDASEGKITKLKRITRQSVGPTEFKEQNEDLDEDKKTVSDMLPSILPNEDNEKPQSRRSSIGSKNQGNKKNLETKISGNTAVEKVKVASIGKRKSGGDRDSCDTVHSGSSGMIDCKVVLESLGDIGRDVQRSSKKFKSNSKVTVENIQEIITEERQSKDNISSTTCSSNNSNEGPNFSDKKSEHRSENKDVSQKPKQSISETWRQAFKNAKLPKPGQLSPVPHTVKPFVRQKLTNSSNLVNPFPIKQVDSDPKGNDSLKPQKLPPNLSPFKAMLVNQNQRSVSPDVKRNASPAHKINFGGRDSPFKRSEEMKADFKKQETPAKSFTQLQYEKRSSEFINSLLDPGPSILPAFDSIKPFKKEVRKDDAKDQKTGDVSDNLSTTSSELIPQIKPPPEQGKHLNLPLAVEHTLRKMSPVTVSKKPIIVKPVIASSERRNENNSSLMKQIGPIEKKVENPSDLSASASASASCSLPSRDLLVREPTDLGLMAKKKVNMTAEEINRWLNDDTSSGIEHKKDCGIFENNQCECGCGFRTCKEGTDNSVGMSELVSKDDGKIDHGVVEPPVQLKELDQARKYEAETISTCKVEDYKEKLLTKNCTSENKMAPPKPRKSSGSDKFKSNRSMTDEEMCDFDFRFERTSTVSPRESMSDLSSITPRDDCSSSSEVPERKIFQQRRLGTKRPSLSKSPSAFSAENESSIYAFKSDPPPSKPFRRGREKSGENEDDQPSSSSIAVQVNIENETESVLECSTQTDREEEDDCERDDRLFYIPLPVGQVERGMSQGVAVKVGTEGPDQRVIMRAKLVTKADRNFPSSSRGLLTSGRKQRPEQKVRPLYCREPTSREHRTSDQGTTTDKEKGQPILPSQSNQTTQVNQNSPKGPDSPRIKNLSKPQKVDEFPPNGTPATLVEAPTYYPSEKEFQDPLEYIERLTPLAQSFGICRIVPPKSFKPECKVTDEMRFTAYNQYVHKMMERWGPNVREMSAIRKYLKTQSITLVQVPSIGSMEVDLPRLYQTVQQCGGLKEVIEKKRWARVADTMRIPKSAQDRVTKLDDIYCKYLLPYDTLSHGERSKLLEEVEDEWKERQKRLAAVDEDTGSGSSSDESVADDRDECIAKGRSMPLSAFYRTARNTMAMWFKDGSPSAAEVEAEYWKHVSQKTCHVCVHSGSIDSGTWGYGFPTTKTSATSRHPWNLKVLTNSPGSILRSLGPVMGITVPTLHVGMLFSSCCWYRDPHALPWIEYLHTGANKIWYGVPDSWCSELREAMYPLLPRHTRDRTIWLPSDTMMVPPTYLLDGGASLCRVVQEPGQFILVFPKSFTSSISTGYVVSESVYFAQPSWLNTAEQVFKDIHDSCEPPVFSLHKLLFNVANDTRSSAETLIQILPMVKAVVEQEVESRKKLEKIGLTSWEKVLSKSGRRNKKQEEDPSDLECDTCRGALFLSMVTNSHEDCSYCIQHAVEALSKDQTLLKYCKLKFAYDEEEMEELIEKVKNKIETKTLKKQAKEKGSSSGSKN